MVIMTVLNLVLPLLFPTSAVDLRTLGHFHLPSDLSLLHDVVVSHETYLFACFACRNQTKPATQTAELLVFVALPLDYV